MKDSYISIIISAGISLIAFVVTSWFNLLQLRNAKNKLLEDINFELIKLRVEIYSNLMADLKIVSSYETKDLSNEKLKEKLKALIESIQRNIFGKVGLIASHEAREMILRLRGKCSDFIEERIDFKEVHMAAMVVHQILRSDLGLSQPGLDNIIEKFRRSEIAERKEQIESIANGMTHIKWT